jgi:DNA topoisomerase-1
LITYHRTDGLDLSEERLAAIREHVAALFPGPNRLSSTVRKYKREAKNAQEAHEAITVVKPAAGPKVNGHFSRAERMLHELIFRRSLACQMEPATFKQVSCRVHCSHHPG